jgi:hypothetical protein
MLCVHFSRALDAEFSEFSITCKAASGRIRLLALSVICAGVVGCSGGPPALRPPVLDPESAAKEAVALYDKDGDGILTADELKACPGILVSLELYDQDGDGSVTEAEIAARLSDFVDRNVALSRLSATVLLDRRPLGGATIRLVPEPYLGEEIKQAVGTTRKGGSGSVAVADEDLPDNQKGIRGIHSGTYRVEITHPEISIPAKYNTETTLGYETKPGDPYATFELKSR